ncbi:MAG TPA: alpha-amylase family glycosyl hydrolase [Kiritimatiellia bacterium]|nr:alpha-amylase family glycosyl hydrolase [Kiritimatiellia bacterium]
MKTFFRSLAACLALSAACAAEFEVRYSPLYPSVDDVIQIELHGVTQGGTLHWGVNAVGTIWEMPLPTYRPDGSEQRGVATRTRLAGPDEDGISRIALGPFNDTNQLVRALNFAIQWDDGAWSNKDEKNYNIPVSFGRVRIEPEVPTINDHIVVKVRRSRAGGQLRWGVNAENDMWQPPVKAYWPAGTIPARDGLAVDSPLSRPDADGISTAVLGPFNRADQVIHTLHMAVHWGDDWDTDAGRNYNVEISFATTSNQPSVRILSPRDNDAIVDAPEVDLVAYRADRVDLLLNGTNIASVAKTPLELKLPFEQLRFGRHQLTARAERNGAVALQQINFWKLPPHRVESIPPGTAWGATDNGDGTVTFALHAPGKRFVSVVGDFNEWDAFADMMNYSPDGTWWLTRPVSNGVWKYQYAIEGLRLLADPLSHDVEWKDERGREGYQPWDARTVLRVGQPDFVWTATNYVRPPLDQLVIYELHIGDLQPGGGFTGLITKLDYIKDMGFNAIGPMPWTEFSSDESWGYNPAFHLAPESSYGTPEQLKQLINEAHLRGIAVIKDAVYNHMDRSGPLFQLYGHDYAASPFFREYRGENWGFPDLDQQSRATKRYLQDAITHWHRAYRVDGIRYDATRFVEWEGYNDWGAGWLAWCGRQADPASYQIAEHMPSDPALINQTEMDTTWGDYFRWNLRGMIEEARLDRNQFADLMIPTRIGFTSALQRIAFTESHDEERVMYELKRRKFGTAEARRRAEMAYAFTLMAPGPAMVYAGQEFGEDTKKFVGSNPIQWNKTKGWLNRENRRLHAATRALTRLRTTHTALRGEWVNLHDGLPDGVVALDRTGNNGSVLAAGNLGRMPQRFTVTLPHPGPWRAVLPDRVFEASGGTASLFLAPGEVAVFAAGE